jgi:Protein of unknown function (DUF2786)
VSIDGVMERIAKIQRLAERGGTPAEAAAAASKVQELLAKHSITLAEVAIAAGAELTGYGHRQQSTGSSGWRRSLLSQIALSNMCRAIYLRSKVDVFGHRDNVQVVLDLYTWLACEIDRLADEAWEREGSGSIRSWKHRYREGAVETIVDHLIEEREHREDREHREAAASNTSTALMVIHDRVDVAVHKVYPVLVSRSRRVAYGRGYDTGARDARKIALGRTARIGGGSHAARIGAG